MITWSNWSVAAFERARREEKPVLLSLVASWCHACHEMHRTSFADRSVESVVEQSFVPVLVDSDQRPDINERYNLGGWPTTVFLSPGGEILTGGTFFPARQLHRLLTQVASTYRSGRDEVPSASSGPVTDVRIVKQPTSATATAGHDIDRDAPRWVRDHLVEMIDRTHGGYGVEPKFPHAPALQFAVEWCARSADPLLANLLTATLDAMAGGGLYDPVAGGFFRYSAARDWSLPHSEKLLEDNAALMTVFCDAWRTFDHAPYRDTALDIIRYVESTLTDRDHGGFYNSQRAHTAYYLLGTGEERQTMAPPPVDRSRYVDANAAMVSAYLHTGEALQNDMLCEFAIDSFDRLMADVYTPARGVRHAEGDGSIGGLFGDQVGAATALLDAYKASDREPYRMLAEELMLYAVRTMWDGIEGGFFDRVQADENEAALLRERIKPFALNCAAARVLAQLADATSNSGYRDLAHRALASQTSSYRAQGPLAAEYARAVEALPE